MDEFLKQKLKVKEKRIAELESELEELNKYVEWLENSKFWKLRKAVYRLYRLITGKNYQPGQLSRQSFLSKFIKKSKKSSFIIDKDAYTIWRTQNVPKKKDLEAFKANIKSFTETPTISILMPVHHTDPIFLRTAIESVINQIYSNWELCIATDNSTNEATLSVLKGYANNPKIKISYRNNEAYNVALELASGSFALLFNQDDLLTEDCLYRIVHAINEDETLDLIYTDEDKKDSDDFFDPHFKPDWSPDNMLSRNYLGHGVVLRTSLLKEAGGFRKEFGESQNFDLFLRVTEKTERIKHIPKVLYHLRTTTSSIRTKLAVKESTSNFARKAIEEALSRRKETASVKMLSPGYYNTIYAPLGVPKVSIIIPGKNNVKVTNRCIDSIFKKSTYSNFEIILIDNGSDESAFFEMTEHYQSIEPNRFFVHTHDIPFNFSKLVNFGAEQSTGDYLVLLNNDTEIITLDWIEKMLGQAQRDSIGVVGVKLYFPNDTVQHAGVVIGIGGTASHIFGTYGRNETGYYNYLLVSSNFLAVTAACCMVKKEHYFEVGGFDEALAHDFNDVDFCLKIKDLGLNNLFIPYVELYHYESLSRGNLLKDKTWLDRYVRESVIFKQKWSNYILKDPCYNPNLSLTHNDFRIKLEK